MHPSSTAESPLGTAGSAAQAAPPPAGAWPRSCTTATSTGCSHSLPASFHRETDRFISHCGLPSLRGSPTSRAKAPRKHGHPTCGQGRASSETPPGTSVSPSPERTMPWVANTNPWGRPRQELSRLLLCSVLPASLHREQVHAAKAVTTPALEVGLMPGSGKRGTLFCPLLCLIKRGSVWPVSSLLPALPSPSASFPCAISSLFLSVTLPPWSFPSQ